MRKRIGQVRDVVNRQLIREAVTKYFVELGDLAHREHSNLELCIAIHKRFRWTLPGHMLAERAMIRRFLISLLPREAKRIAKASSIIPKRAKRLPKAPPFYKQTEWRTIRYEVIAERGNRCECCGAVPAPENDIIIHVDHIKPKSKYPHLALVKENLQVLCQHCNGGKSNADETDWRRVGTAPRADGATA